MTVGTGASGFLGIAPETTAGTYVAPTKYMLLRGEDFQYNEERISRRPLRGIADVSGHVAGNFTVGGTYSIEVTADQLPHILRASRATCVKTGAGPYEYVWTPSHVAIPAKTLSVTIVRNGVAFGYVGCVVSAQSYTVDGGLLVATLTFLGTDEANQSVPSPSYITADPYGPGLYDIQVPTASTVTDTDTFTFTVDDAAEAQFRLRNTSRGAAFNKYGERSVSLMLERDFESRTDYDAFKALTAQGITINVQRNATTDRVKFLVPAAIKTAYPISGLSGQADLIRASITYEGTYHAGTSKSYEITINTTENVTVP
jgi:hypothetical protein